ncbi:MAG: hypothetical protein M3R13_10380 [Armatimonadota bacterium]|nr:hypothetical protein [Armatimonadota bacterium]
MKCSQFRGGITQLAFGDSSPEAEQHAAVCPHCTEALSELRKVAEVFALGAFDAPGEVVQRAKSIALATPSALRLTKSTLAFSGARRTATDSFQRLFEAGHVTVRVMYSRSEDEWIVTGRATPTPNEIRIAGRRIEGRDGNFEFKVKDLTISEIEVRYPSAAFTIPAGSEDVENVGG